jgi:hypothetical protein
MGLQTGVTSLLGVSMLIVTWLFFIRFLTKRCSATGAKGPLPFSDLLNRRPIISSAAIALLFPLMHVFDQVATAYFSRTLIRDGGQAVNDIFMTQAISSLGMTCLLLAGATLAIQKLRKVSS